ncbi:MAG: mechanosensitive ion channel [Coriobacteriia bacterium]|nr:mechanosensitive ion channel [Coriobacteriia bacterium]
MDLLARMAAAFSGGVTDAFEAISRAAATRLPGVLAGLIVLAVAWVIGRVVFVATRRVLSRRSTQAHVDVLVARVARGAVMSLGIVLALAVAGFNVATLVTSLGLAGLTLGFALRDVLANSVAGVMLLIQRPFRLGDTILVASIEGVVTDVRVRDTAIKLSDGRVAYVPNITVFNGVVVNSSQEPVRRFEISVWTPSGQDLETARAAVLGAVASTPGVIAEPAAEAQVASVGPDRARVLARGWVDTRVSSLGDTQSLALAAARGALGTTDSDAEAEGDTPALPVGTEAPSEASDL